MKITALHYYRTFLICRGALTDDDPLYNPGEAPGEFNQFLYSLRGTGLATSGDTVIALEEGALVDLTGLKGKGVLFSSTTEMAAWVAFNPKLPGISLEVEILKANPGIELLDNTLETYIVPIQRSVQVNGSTLEEFQSGRLLAGKPATLTVPEGSICAIVKTQQEGS